MNDVDKFFSLRARIVDLARTVEADPAQIGVLSTGEACAVAMLLGRLDLLHDYKHPLDALERLGPNGKSPSAIFTAPGGGSDLRLRARLDR